MSVLAGALGLVDRVGAALVSPRALLREEARAPHPRGLGDLTVLLLVRLIATELPDLARAVAFGLDHGPLFGVVTALHTFEQIVPDVAGILVGAVALSLLGGAAARSGGRSLDLAAYAYVPYLAVAAAAWTFSSLRGHDPSRDKEALLHGTALVWSVVVWVLALLAARSASEQPETTTPAGSGAP
jgi:hypothetical protein